MKISKRKGFKKKMDVRLTQWPTYHIICLFDVHTSVCGNTQRQLISIPTCSCQGQRSAFHPPPPPCIELHGSIKGHELTLSAVCQTWLELRPVNQLFETFPGQQPPPPSLPSLPLPQPVWLSVTQHSFSSPLSSSLPSSLHPFTLPCHVVSQSKALSLLVRAA